MAPLDFTGSTVNIRFWRDTRNSGHGFWRMSKENAEAQRHVAAVRDQVLRLASRAI
jgi:hypothetical protein